MTKNKLYNNDVLKGDFTLYVEDQLVPEYSKFFEITIGKNEYLPDVDEFLINRKVKDSLEVKLTFNKHYAIQEFAGKTAKIEIKNIEIIKDTASNNDELEQLKSQLAQAQLELINKDKRIVELEMQYKRAEWTFKEKATELTTKAKEQVEAKQNELVEKMNQEKAQIKKYALQKFLEDFIEPFNNFQLANQAGINSDDAKVKNYCLGFSMIARQFIMLLEQHNASLIEPQVGAEFNPEQEEVIDFVQDETKANNTIVRLVRYGLKIEDRLVKPASVVVVKNN
ncbi:nucleotide exchange factor GrpE [Mycoplasma sp. Pen4]|uniref:nucleotide exchange factor GrpE n=1 Tax=Mycoplasma sp. Pen4 TaxID=640330 RepID=UPI001653F833|nr:nucleotide exchange factor GrpE [Mycoplasma sp. Pen4]QNM93782.1 nucleotide exchange factor GrpE [Mycoplasma sp. Pen4]